MEPSSVTRRLAAIVIADVAGYTRLIERDDAGTLARLREIREQLVDPKITEYGGRVVRVVGDGMLLEFGSADAALRCAVDVQRGMGQRNASLAVDERIEFRIGINIGDIIVEGNDIAGDGVNLASRLEALAEPGGICVSAAVREQVHGALDVGFEDIGEQQVKNIMRPVRVYRIRDPQPHGVAATQLRQVVKKRGWFFSRIPSRARPGSLAGAAAFVVAGIAIWYVFVQPRVLSTDAGPPLMSVAVMPFTPASAGADDERFAERFTQDLTSAVERSMPSALVVSHGLVEAKYRDKPIDPRAVGHDLNVRYLVEGDVRGENGTVAVTAQLIETTNGTQVWNHRVAAPAGDEGNRGIVAQLQSPIGDALYDAERKRVARLPLAGASATELALHADALEQQDPSPKGQLEAQKLYQEAIRRDPASVPAILGVARAIVEQLFSAAPADQERLVKEMDQLSSRAVRADRNDPRAWGFRMWALEWQQQWDGALEANEEALRIDPYRMTTLGYRAYLMLYTGRPAEALPIIDRAIALNPRSPFVAALLEWRCAAHLNLGQYDDAIAACEKSLALGDEDAHLLLVGAYAQKGDMAKAATEKEEVLKLQPDVSIARLKALPYWRHPLHVQQREAQLFAGLRKAGIPEQ